MAMDTTRPRSREFFALPGAGIAIRIFVFLFQGPFNNDNHLEVIDWIRTHRTLPLSNQLNQAYHPPLYFLMAQLFYTGSHSVLGLKCLQSLSLLASILAFIALACLLWTALSSARARRYAILFAALLFQLILFGNYVSPDGLSILIGALIFVQAFRYADRPTMTGRLVLAVLLGLGLLTKGAFLAFVPVVYLLVTVVELTTESKAAHRYANLALFVVLSVLIGSYKYWENFQYFGRPFVLNTDPEVQQATGDAWAEDQKGTYQGIRSLVDIDLLKLIAHPTASAETQHSYPLLMYGSFWYQYIPESNLTGNLTKWKYLGSVIYALALVPTALMLLGLWMSGRASIAAFRDKELQAAALRDCFAILSLFAVTGLVVCIGVESDVWSCFQSRLVFPAFFVIAYLLGRGLAAVGEHTSCSKYVHVALGILYSCFVAYSCCLIKK